jgi:hypothetical protein
VRAVPSTVADASLYFLLNRGEPIFDVKLTGLAAAIENVTANATSPPAAPEVRVVTKIDDSGVFHVLEASAVFPAPNVTVEDKGLGGKLKGFFGGKDDTKKEANETEAAAAVAAALAKDEVKKDIVKKLGLEFSYPAVGPLTREQKWASRAK